MVLITPISIGTILIILLFILSPIYALGLELKDLFLYLDTHKIEFIAIAFLIFLVIAVISFLFTKELNAAIPIFLNGPMIGIAPAFWLAEFFVTWAEQGLIWALFTQFLIFILQLLAWGAIIFVGVISFIFCAGDSLEAQSHTANKENTNNKKKVHTRINFLDDFLLPFGISAIALLIQYFLLIILL